MPPAKNIAALRQNSRNRRDNININTSDQARLQARLYRKQLRYTIRHVSGSRSDELQYFLVLLLPPVRAKADMKWRFPLA